MPDSIFSQANKMLSAVFCLKDVLLKKLVTKTYFFFLEFNPGG